MLSKCEGMGLWPEERTLAVLVRLAKPDGGSHMIGLLGTILRVWGKL